MNKKELEQRLRELDKERHLLQKDLMTTDIILKNYKVIDKYLDSPYKFDCKVKLFDKFTCDSHEIYIPVHLSIDLLTAMKLELEHLKS